MKKLLLFFALVIGVSFFVSAQSAQKVVKTQVNQSVKIAQGVVNGALTRREAEQLKKKQRHLQNEKKIAELMV